MNKDGVFNHLHLARGQHPDLFEEFCRDRLPADDIYVPPHHAPINPEDEDDVVPDQHAAFGIQKALHRSGGGGGGGGAGGSGAGGSGGGGGARAPGEPPAWRDLGLEELMRKGPQMGKLTGGGRNGLKGSVLAGRSLPR